MRLTNLFTTALLMVCSCALAMPGRADISATVRMGTGEFRFTNSGESDYTLVAYSISQEDPELLAQQWLHVANLRDAAGDGSVDNTGTWLIIEPDTVVLPATSSELSEGALTGTGGVLAPGGYLYLGAIWDNTTLRNIEALVSDELGPFESVNVNYVPTGDYNEDGLVDGSDYELWKQSFGLSGLGLLADGNADGQVNLVDYSLWRNNLGATSLPPDVTFLPVATAVSIPEPGAALLAIGLAAFVGCSLRRNLFRV
ncbi:dockerin type I domain-containing protein [Aeoliella sp.]|uniref:dockerin type I domain-containing protein n=1 Tax=Aeoliella sp. TaxID=2795800 RepID=UPI003CCBC374